MWLVMLLSPTVELAGRRHVQMCLLDLDLTIKILSAKLPIDRENNYLTRRQ